MKREDELDSIELARTIIDAIAEKKGSDILLLDIRPVSLLADYFVICSGETERQIKAITDEVLERTTKAKVVPLHIEGEPPSGGVLMDYGSVIVHIFAPAERDYYRLEELWSDAPVVVKVL